MPEQPPAPTFTRRMASGRLCSTASFLTFAAAFSVSVTTAGSSELLGFPAAAGRLLLRVLDLEAGGHGVLGVVDRGVLEELDGVGVDDDVERLLRQDGVVLPLVVEAESVL